jgi:hypothetical protein
MIDMKTILKYTDNEYQYQQDSSAEKEATLMGYKVNGFADMYTVLSNERKIGGAIEAKRIRLRTGEEFLNPVIINVDYNGSVFYSLGFITEKGEHYIVNVQEISMVFSTRHCKIHELTNEYYKNIKTNQRIQYLKRLCEVNQGSCTKIFKEEVQQIVDDIGIEAVTNVEEIKEVNKKENILRIA